MFYGLKLFEAMEKYSLAIRPSDEIVFKVKQVKSLLREESRTFFRSQNSEAHISIFEYEVGERQGRIIANTFSRLVPSLRPFVINYKGFNHFQNGDYYTFYIQLNALASNIIREYASIIKKECRFSLKNRCSIPHMSVGRHLNQNQLNIAYGLFKSFEQTDFCNSFVLRIFNPLRKQYDIIANMPLLGTDNSKGQLNLFS